MSRPPALAARWRAARSYWTRSARPETSGCTPRPPQSGGAPRLRVEQQPPADLMAFVVIRVEERGVCRAPQDGREFPAEVDGVLDAGVHALAAGRQMDVCGVAGQQEIGR